MKEYAEEVEGIFKSLLDIREVRHTMLYIQILRNYLWLFFSTQKVNASVKAMYKLHTNYGRVFRYTQYTSQGF